MSKERKNNSNAYAEIKPGKSPKFKRGNPGRQKGSKNKFTTLKDAYLNTFVKLGGEDWLYNLVKSSKRNEVMFAQLITKMLPSNLNVEGDLNITYQISDKFMPKTGNEKK